MKRIPRPIVRGCLAAMLAVTVLLSGCAVYTPPQPQMGQVANPAALPGAVLTAEWDIGATRYVWQGQGLNYYEAGLFPVLLLFNNHSGRYPVIYAQECRGIGAGGAEYPPYSVDQAAEVVFASTAYKKSAEAAVVGGLTGAAVGAGLGALIGSGFNHGWGAGPGALIGAGVGALGGAAISQQPSMDQYRSSLYQEMGTYAWRPAPIAPGALVPGYLYFPANVGIHSLRVILRVDNYTQTYIVPISQPAW
ncbi:MAG: YMGG-like glycine zipper-containing protein [Solidesulfovibrio sp.]|uniref:YMGG-like glycine zipper-containing protein n=1 Tax=Solidesulfovibrio sp. TaxID=2910990 RepID=UPI00315874C3